jgi:hypothetical protein
VRDSPLDSTLSNAVLTESECARRPLSSADLSSAGFAGLVASVAALTASVSGLETLGFGADGFAALGLGFTTTPDAGVGVGRAPGMIGSGVPVAGVSVRVVAMMIGLPREAGDAVDGFVPVAGVIGVPVAGVAGRAGVAERTPPGGAAVTGVPVAGVPRPGGRGVDGVEADGDAGAAGGFGGIVGALPTAVLGVVTRADAGAADAVFVSTGGADNGTAPWAPWASVGAPASPGSCSACPFSPLKSFEKIPMLRAHPRCDQRPRDRSEHRR